MSSTRAEDKLRIEELLTAEQRYVERIHALEQLILDMLEFDLPLFGERSAYERAEALGLSFTDMRLSEPPDQCGDNTHAPLPDHPA